MEAEQILKRIGYDNNSITSTEKWIAKEVYKLAMEDASSLRHSPVSGECEHPYSSVLYGNDIRPTQCLKCGKAIT